MSEVDIAIRDRLDKVFDIINQDPDATLSFAEFKDLLTGEGQEISDQKAIRTAKQMLAQADSDGSRSVTKEEWEGMFFRLKVFLSLLLFQRFVCG